MNKVNFNSVTVSCIQCKRTHAYIGQFGEAGLHECWFTLCMTVEIEPRIVKQYKCHDCCVCKHYEGNVMEDGEKGVFASFSG